MVPKGPCYNQRGPIFIKLRVYCNSLHKCLSSSDHIPSTHFTMQSLAIAVMDIVPMEIEIQQAVESCGCSHKSVDIAESRA